MNEFLERIGAAVLLLGWLFGTVFAKAGWATAAAIFLPPYGWYLCAERFAHWAGWL